MSMQELAEKEKERRERRNLRDRLAREFLQSHPEIKDDPDSEITDEIPDGTTEAAVRSIARHYSQMKKVREMLRTGDGLATA